MVTNQLSHGQRLERTFDSLRIINRIARDQLQRKLIFSFVVVVAPVEIIDISGITSCLIDIDESLPKYQDAINEIKAAVQTNLELFKSVEQLHKGSQKAAYYFIDEHNRVSVLTEGTPIDKIPKKYNEQVLTNNQLSNYCQSIKAQLDKMVIKDFTYHVDQLAKGYEYGYFKHWNPDTYQQNEVINFIRSEIDRLEKERENTIQHWATISQQDWNGKEIDQVIHNNHLQDIDAETARLHRAWDNILDHQAADARRLAKDMKPATNEEPHPTVKQIALYFYYLSNGKEIRHPQRAQFIKEQFHNKPPYNFDRSGKSVYNAFMSVDEWMNKSDIEVVIDMLEGHAAPQGLAKNDLASYKNK